MAAQPMPANHPGRPDDSRFVVIGCSVQKRELTLGLINRLLGDVPILAPVRTLMVRPRRKSVARRYEPVMRRVPIFYEYMAIGAVDGWRGLYGIDSAYVWYILRDLARAHHLETMCERRETDLTSWEGRMVEFIGGPMKGFRGKYQNGRIDVSFFGKRCSVKVNTFDIRVAQNVA